jgi:lactoylglutathione lyase
MPDALTQPRWTHVALPVSDLERSIEFYTTICPLVVVARHQDENGQGAWLSNDKQVEDPFVLVISEFVADVGARFGVTPGEKVPTLTPFAHIGIELPSRADVDAVAERARAIDALRWEPRDMPAHIGYICAVSDPDGNVVEFSHNQQVFAAIKALWGSRAT